MRLVFAVLVFVALASVTQATFWGTPNVRPCNGPISCNVNAAVYPEGYTTDGCATHSFNIWLGDAPHNKNGSDISLNRVTVPAGTYLELKQIHMVFTFKFTTYTSWSYHPNGVNLSLSIWNTSHSNPNRANDWSTPIINDQRFLFNRSSGETWGFAYGLYTNLSTPIVLSAGDYIFGTQGYQASAPPTHTADVNFVWFQNTAISSNYSTDDDLVVYVGNALSANSQLGLPLIGQANYTTFTATFPARLCSWWVGALHNLTDGTVDDPTLSSLSNQAGFLVRYPVKSNILDLDLRGFVNSMNAALNVASISPYATVQVYQAKREWETSYIDWFVNTKWGASAMQQGLTFNGATVLSLTGLTLNGNPATINTPARDT
jgi:hypothetical protein